MKKIRQFSLLSAVLAFSGILAAQQPSAVIEWSAEHYPAILQVEGTPGIVQTGLGPAVRFNGETDAVFLDVNPLKGLGQFTMEVIFRPDGDGKFAQRFMHLGEVRGERIMFETRVNPDKTWYFDAHTQLPNGGEHLTLIDDKLLHPTDRWYNVTLVVSPTMQTTYVNGTPQKWGYLNYVPIDEGISSVGVRQNKVDFFKGTIYKIRITPRVLLPREFLKDYEELNR